MASGKWSTGDYPETARKRLGTAHRRARQSAGYKYRPAYAKAVGVSKGSIVNLEAGAPVGEFVVEAVARALPGWTEDTPRQILEGAPPPEPAVVTEEAEVDTAVGDGESGVDPPVASLEWLEKYADHPELVRKWKELKRLESARDALVRYLAERAVQVAERELSEEHG